MILGGHIGNEDMNGSRQISLSLHDPAMPYYYCELLERTGVMKFGLVDNPGSTFNTDDASTTTAMLANGDFMLDIGAPATAASCFTTWPTDRATLSASIPPLTVGKVEILAQGMEMQFHYVIVIGTN